MARRPLLLVCCALGLAAAWGARATEPPEPPDTLQNEADNQENVLSQLLGDYDKVKAVSEGADCQCKCVVRPLGREACRRVDAGAARLDDSYTVETITSGPACKCACVAPPSALNPCEGDFRLQKLREADGRDLKLSTVLDMLEGALYGLDLLKLHSVTTKLLGRVDRLEEEVSRNLTQENEQIKEHIAEIRSEVRGRSREGCCRSPPDGQPRPDTDEQRDAAATYARPEVNSVELLGSRPLARPAVARPPRPPHRPAEPRGRPASRPTIIRGITYYKAQEPEEDDNDIEEPQDEFFSGDPEMDLLSEEQLLRHSPPPPAPTPTASTPPASAGQWATPLQDAGDAAATPTVTPPSPPASAVPLATAAEAPYTAPTFPTATGTEATDGWGTGPAGPTLSPEEEEEDIRSSIGKCKDTLSTISGPTLHNTYGRNEGAWMKDPLASDERIYVTNYHYGNTLVEFRNHENFKQGRWSNSYKLPYSWMGTGHAVYGGAFFYSRAFTRTILKYDLRRRYVAAWALLHDVAFEEATPWRWRGHSDVHFAVDENGLWLIYPALDEDDAGGGLGQEVMVLSKLDAADLSTRRDTTWRTGLRRHRYGNCFVICGVLYAVDSAGRRHANLSYAFDTHTNTQTAPRLPFENRYSYTTQVGYNPKDRLLYAWDNGHQVTYQVIFAY
ncbi:olfactomedin-like protein 2B [Sorex araneus]|uniref:olfactomedin-like protein 2B n=1 Tax=Sorex araneus TaxID=42254 RepID=UPI002433D33D|nr:olfactomedin-like protein 2B [Sorex araneus]